MSYLMIFIAAIFVNNIVLSQFFGNLPVFGCFPKNLNRFGDGLCRHVRNDNLSNCHSSDLLSAASA